MFIKTVALGNANEAFVESRLTNGFNIIYSTEDNNKGKTIVIQSLMFALGNQPIFPSGFPFNDYYHLCEVVDGDSEYLIVRKKNQFSIMHEGSLTILDSVTEFKHYLKKYLFDLPELPVNGIERVVYPYLFYQIFFIGQDKRNCSDITNKGQYNKADFKEMICRYSGISPAVQYDDLSSITEKINNLTERKDNLLKQNNALLKGTGAAKQLYSITDSVLFESKCKKMEEINQQITELRKERNKTIQRSMNVEGLIAELKSLNKALDVGIVKCMDCGSHNITYTSKDNSFVFDVTNKNVQSDILQSLERKKSMLEEESDEIKEQISNLQNQLDIVLNEEGTSLESLMAYKNRNDLREINTELESICRELSNLKRIKKVNKKEIDEVIRKKKELLNKIVSSMNYFYSEIDPDGRIVFEDLFTLMQDTYSGSEETEFFLSRIYALARILNHPYPIVIDSFREGELSTDKEDRTLSIYKQLPNQIIFTATLKTEENHKYNKDPELNSICYDSNTTSHILNEKDAFEMKQLLEKMGITLSDS